MKPPQSAPFAFALICSLSLVARAAAEDLRSPDGGFSLAQAVVNSLKESPALQIQEQTIEEDKGVLQQATGQFDWIGTAGASVTRQRTPVLGPPGTAPVGTNNTADYSVGVSKEFRNGISITPSANVGVNRTATITTPTYGASAVSLVVNVPLLKGLGTDSTGAAEAAARGDVVVAALLYQHALAGQVLTVATDYWAVRAADESLNIQRDMEKSAEKLVSSTKALVDSQVFTPAFLIQAEANLRDKRSARISAELSARTARYALGLSIGVPPEKIGSTPVPNDPFPALGPVLAPADETLQTALINRALAARADMQASRASVVPLNSLVRQAEIDLKPAANLMAAAGYNGLSTGQDPIRPLSQRVTGVNGQLGVSIAWPFQNNYQRGLLHERRASVQVAVAQTDELARSVATDVLVALEQVRLTADGVRSAQETVDLAKRAVAAQYESLKAGTGTILDIIQLENLYAEARINYVSAYSSYATAIAHIHYALGITFSQPNPSAAAFTLNDLTSLPPL